MEMAHTTTSETEKVRDSMDTLPNPDLRPDATEEGGEGNIEADRRYREGVAKTVKSGKVEELAEDAAEALDGPEGEALRKAEKQGKASSHKPS